MTLFRPQLHSSRSLVLSRPPSSLWAHAWHRLIRDARAILGMFLMAFFICVAIFTPVLAPDDPLRHNLARDNLPPAWVEHSATGEAGDPRFLLGTDTAGRDLLSRTIYGAQISMAVGLIATPLVALMGALIGLIAGYAGSRIDNLVMRIADIFYAFPTIMFCIIAMAMFRGTTIGQSRAGLFAVLLAALVLTEWVGVARLVRGMVLSLKGTVLVEAARCVGASHWRIVIRHILPNCLGLIMVWMAFAVPRMIIVEAVLGYLGVGLNMAVNSGRLFFVTSWGEMFLEGRSAIYSQPILLLLPTVCVGLVGIAFTLLGDSLRDAFDPRTQV